jgi:hypothetical protein
MLNLPPVSAGTSLGLRLFDPEDGSDVFLWNAALSPNYAACTLHAANPLVQSVCEIFNDSVSSSECITLRGRIISKKYISRDVEGSG